MPLSVAEYNFRNYITYALYPPLYIAGPIITFNDWHAQVQKPIASQTSLKTLLYGLRTLGDLLTIETLLHLFWVVAIKDAQAWDSFSPLQLNVLAYLNLMVVWLKLWLR